MRLLPLGFAIAAAVTLASCESGPKLPEGPYCAVTTALNSQTENCYMPSLDACRREVSGGNRGFCRPNPRYAAPRR